jgi:hypothetical protein
MDTLTLARAIIICPQQFEIMPGYEIIIKIGLQMHLTKE